ncbi:MAG TPA: PIN domain-containing protein [Coriobacteriia bacterium]|jgi:tetratricopeptide (TPR) repeat protein
MRTVVLDTNVLLSDPDVLLSFRDAEVVIPETVLSELDKLKTSRVDPDLRFRGREVSRLLFELSEQGNLVAGVALPDGGKLRVVPLDTETSFPEELSPKNADDRILAVALQLRNGDGELVLVTNDLNMLLKAQTLGVEVQRHFDGAESTFARRFIIRPFQRYKVPLAILAIALAVFAAIILLSLYNPLTTGQQQIPQEFKDQLTSGQRDVLDQLISLQRNPGDVAMETKLANTYFNLAQTGHINNAQYASYAVQHYQHVLQEQPNSLDVRTDMAIMEFTLGQTDQAIQDTVFVLQKKPDHLQANFNLGIFYWQGRHDLRSAEAQFNKVIELTKADPQQSQILKDAEARLAAVKKEESQAGTGSAGTTSTGGAK